MNAVTLFVRLGIGAMLISAAGCDLPPISLDKLDKSVEQPIVLPTQSSTLRASFLPGIPSAPSISLPAPPPPRMPEQGISGQDAGYAESELPFLLGYLWYPDAKLSLCSHTQRNQGHWSLVTLILPTDEKPRDIINYYEVRYPSGERKGNEEYSFETKRPGDDRPTQVHLFLAQEGSEATQYVVRIRS